MTLTGKRKAAMLLMSLDAATATELVRNLDSKVVQELAVELAYLDLADFKSSNKGNRIVRQFHHSLKARETFQLNDFLDKLLKSSIGQEKAEWIQAQIQDLLCNPFVSICSADARTLALVLRNEHPQTIAAVLSELPAPKGQEVLHLLDGSVQVSVIGRMSECAAMTAEAKELVAEKVCQLFNAISINSTGRPLPSWSEQSLRKIALIVRGLDKEIRDGLLSAIHDKDNQAGEMAAKLMIIWADMPQITDRSLREALSRVDANTLALALSGADEAIINKVRSILSERSVAAVDKRASLISAPREGGIGEARERIVGILRRMNDECELGFIDNGCDVYDIVG
jgi:flagellar motor switch protein FliG